jgi:hypothetical protein
VSGLRRICFSAKLVSHSAILVSISRAALRM